MEIIDYHLAELNLPNVRQSQLEGKISESLQKDFLEMYDSFHDHIAELIEHPAIKRKYAFGNPSEFVRRALADKIAQIEREIKEDKSS